MLTDINKLIDIIDGSLKWADDYSKETFPREEFREYRRRLRRYKDSLSLNCSMAAYGESQVGKSYLISSLLSTPDKPFVIENKGDLYSFIDELNPSGGNNALTESTGVVTRFTLRCDNPAMKDYVKIRNLSVADIIMLIADSYYNDLKIDSSRVLRYDEINTELKNLENISSDKNFNQYYLTSDDVKDICDYIKENLGGTAANVAQSDFARIVADTIQHIKPEDWVKVFSLLWNRNEELNRLFTTLINEYRKLDFRTEVYVPFDAVKREKGTLLKIEWLDGIFGNTNVGENEETTVDILDTTGNVVSKGFPKSMLSALIAELTFILPAEIASDRRFLEKVDLLDFPGARSREKYKEKEIKTVLPTVLRRGKVAYLFNKYSRALNISGLLFCHHNAQKSQPMLGETLNLWIEENIGKTPADRAENLLATNGISPLFFVATKFNLELEKLKTDTPDNMEMLGEHWRRFNIIFPEIIKPATWFDKWTAKGGIFSSEAYQSIYLLRDFYWSGKNLVFDGYSDKGVKSPETAVHVHADYPDYLDRLHDSFIANAFVQKHFRDPEEAWKSVASLNRDGSKEIIRDLNSISDVLDDARRLRYSNEVKGIAREILSKLNVYYEPEDVEMNNKRIRGIISEIRRNVGQQVGKRPETFGMIIDSMMVPSVAFRKIAYDIAVLHIERPIISNEIIMLRNLAGISAADSRDVAISKLSNYYLLEEEELREKFAADGIDFDTILTGGGDVEATEADIISKKILDFWIAFINKQSAALEEYIPHADEVAFMLQTLCLQLGVKKKISEKIKFYTRIFQEEDIPNAIADFASLTLNNFVSSVGREYMDDAIINSVKEKAAACRIPLNDNFTAEEPRRDLVAALNAFDDAEEITTVPIETLMKLPFWNNFQRWNNDLVKGLLYVSDISHANPEANKGMKKLIESCETIL